MSKIQVRGEVSGIKEYDTMQQALDNIQLDDWKVSFTLQCGYRVRLVKQDDNWVMSDLLVEAGLSRGN